MRLWGWWGCERGVSCEGQEGGSQETEQIRGKRGDVFPARSWKYFERNARDGQRVAQNSDEGEGVESAMSFLLPR